MYSLFFKALPWLIGMAVIFTFGVVVGGSFATGSAEDATLSKIEDCLPAEDIDELEPCLAGE